MRFKNLLLRNLHQLPPSHAHMVPKLQRLSSLMTQFTPSTSPALGTVSSRIPGLSTMAKTTPTVPEHPNLLQDEYSLPAHQNV
ncbi:hypothetical protein D9758_018589 [Tetrapyrgos nigripes]|uniref:Uncharacterized protein n=1 Tax=Tetrapyrgos nigripes TaxID=182062 RepID=A0A8H5F018_9AGAR|nr:hypothetical protein D9758_018589 [Tetrapyrgos nigripes]